VIFTPLIHTVMDWVLQVTAHHARRRRPIPIGPGYGRKIGKVARRFLDRRVPETPGFPDLMQETAQADAERPLFVVETVPLLWDWFAECKPVLPETAVVPRGEADSHAVSSARRSSASANTSSRS
jgi:hypothetical protein